VTTACLDGAAATRAVGRALGEVARAGDILLLEGPLGSGKTALVQGLAEGLECADAAASPTFVLVRQHRGRLPLVHADLYRVEDARDAARLGLLELAEDGVLAVEWPDRWPALNSPAALSLRLEPVPGSPDRRLLEVNGGPSHLRIVLPPPA
jgi:tRNA threonylcarbamoyladenosine biosynthesis protein TsaE